MSARGTATAAARGGAAARRRFTAARIAPPPSSARDDLPHRTAELAPLFVGSLTCVPSSDELTFDLEVFDGQLVTCAQAWTRRDASVFLDRWRSTNGTTTARAARATLWSAGRGAPVALDHDYSGGPVLLGGAAYALAGRTLYVLDAKTLRARRSYSLATCH